MFNSFFASVIRTDDTPRGYQCPEMENHDCDNDQLPINPELLWDLWLHLDPYKSMGPGGSHPKVLKGLVGVLQSSQEGQPCPRGHGQPGKGGDCPALL